MKRKLLITSILILVSSFSYLINAKLEEEKKEILSPRGGNIVCPDGAIHMAIWNSFDDLNAVIEALCKK